jgi:hypothetical protein
MVIIAKLLIKSLHDVRGHTRDVQGTHAGRYSLACWPPVPPACVLLFRGSTLPLRALHDHAEVELGQVADRDQRAEAEVRPIQQ